MSMNDVPRYDLTERVRDWTVADLLQFIQAVQRAGSRFEFAADVDPDAPIGDWTVAQLFDFMKRIPQSAPVIPPAVGKGSSLKAFMKDTGRWEDDREVDEVVREIYVSRTVGRDIEL